MSGMPACTVLRAQRGAVNARGERLAQTEPPEASGCVMPAASVGGLCATGTLLTLRSFSRRYIGMDTGERKARGHEPLPPHGRTSVQRGLQPHHLCLAEPRLLPLRAFRLQRLGSRSATGLVTGQRSTCGTLQTLAAWGGDTPGEQFGSLQADRSRLVRARGNGRAAPSG